MEHTFHRTFHQTFHRAAWALAALLAAGAAQAQATGVQLSGSLGAGATQFREQTGGTSLKAVNDNLLTASWLRLAGAEDLGGGLEALFRLESGVAADFGNAGGPGAGGAKFWNRQAWVGLRSSKLGQLTLGRQFHAGTDRALRSFDVYNLAGTSLHVVPMALFGVNRFANNDTRVDNAIKFRTAVPEVLEFGASLAAGEGSTGKSYSADLAHTRKDFEVGLSYVHYDALARVAATGLLPEHEVLSVGGNVTLGRVRAYLSYANSTLDSTVAGRVAQKNKIVALGVNWSVAPAVAVKAAFYDDKGTSLNGLAGRNGKKQTVVASAHYDLSKRTDLYTVLFQNRFSDGYKLDPVNIAALGRDASKATVSGYSLGIRHQF
jgi:predicted porin